MTTPDVRVKRLCDVCFQVDDHPRHVQFVTEGGVPTQAELARIPDGTPAAAIAEILDPTTVVRHFDCCKCESCAVQLNLAGPRVRGAKLLAHIQNNGDQHREAVEKTLGIWDLNNSSGEEVVVAGDPKTKD